MLIVCLVSFFFNDTATTEIYTYGHTLALHDALPIWPACFRQKTDDADRPRAKRRAKPRLARFLHLIGQANRTEGDQPCPAKFSPALPPAPSSSREIGRAHV